jgi:hypothetical protein
MADLLRRRSDPRTHRLARTIDSWHTELLAYFNTEGVSNGPTEAINLLIKKIKRVGHGFRNFDNYRLRLLLHCGVDWKLSARPRSEVGYHAWRRRAANRRRLVSSVSVTKEDHVGRGAQWNST